MTETAMTETAAEPLVLLSRTESVAWITLNRPDALNALSPELVAALEDTVAAVEDDDTLRVVVLTGAGRAFCAGGDLKSFRRQALGDDPASFQAALRHAQAVLRRIERLPKPVIAAVNGIAVAGGLELMLTCDLVVAARSASIGDGHARYGIIPGGGASARLPRRIPVAVAKMLFFTADRLPAAELVGCGLVNQVVEDDRLRDTVAELAGRIARGSPLGLRLIKRLVDEGLDGPLDTALEAELTAFAGYARSDDFAEGLAAFQDRRTPRFRGS